MRAALGVATIQESSGLAYREILDDLVSLGLAPGDLVMVHSSMRAVGPVLGGPDVVIRALLDAVGPSGTVAAYVDWEDAALHLRESMPNVPASLDDYPPFDPRLSRARRAYGVLPEFIRTWPGAVRSGNPDASVAAIGAKAAWLCADHPLQYGYGPGSPLAKLVEAEGKVLLLGAPLESVTLLHYSEHMARLPEKRIVRYREPILVDGAKRWVEIEEFDTAEPVVPGASEDYFGRIVGEYLGRGRSGRVGKAESHLLDAAGLHTFAVRWLESRFGEPGLRTSK